MERISVESEQDKALQVLGETLGTCWFNKATGICNEQSCEGCPTCEKINSCYAYLDDFNKLAAERVAQVHYARLMVNAPRVKERMFEEKYGRGTAYMLSVIKAWLLVMVPILIVVWYCSTFLGCSTASVRPAATVHTYTKEELADYKEKNERLILWVIYESRDVLYDRDGDGKVDCIDYSVAFKETWDRLLYTERDRCRLMVNNNRPAKWCHMFVIIKEVYYPWRTIKIEPQTRVSITDRDKSRMYVENYWGYKYDPAYDLEFGRFRRWLDACKWEGKEEYYIQEGYQR